MIKVAVLDDYQNAFQQIVEIEKYKDKFNFKVFNEPFFDEKFQFYHFIGATFIISGIYLSNRKTQ